MAFVGINGVGKSTSLAKVAYYLKENGIKVWRVGYEVVLFPMVWHLLQVSSGLASAFAVRCVRSTMG